MSHNPPVTETRGTNNPEVDPKASIDDLAGLMQEFRLTEARLQSGGFTVAFRRRARASAAPVAGQDSVSSDHIDDSYIEPAPVAPVAAAPKGIPVTSPMPGIFYSSPNPGAPPFVAEGDVIAAGQIVGLIEAMKVFNEIPSAIAGTVLQVVATSGQIVNPGDVLLYVG